MYFKCNIKTGFPKSSHNDDIIHFYALKSSKFVAFFSHAYNYFSDVKLT